MLVVYIVEIKMHVINFYGLVLFFFPHKLKQLFHCFMNVTNFVNFNYYISLIILHYCVIKQTNVINYTTVETCMQMSSCLS